MLFNLRYIKFFGEIRDCFFYLRIRKLRFKKEIYVGNGRVFKGSEVLVFWF